MSANTSIEWTNKSWNPTTGCSHVSPGCVNCYAETISLRFKRSVGPWTAQNAAENVQMHPDRLDEPRRWKTPLRVFVNSMSDLFHELIPNEFIAQVFTTMAEAERHTFQILTKRPARMREWFQWIEGEGSSGEQPAPTWPLPNVWLGVSVEDQRRADERIPLLLETPAAIRFLSCEPLLGPLNLLRNDITGDSPHWYESAAARLDWVIVGGESGPGSRRCCVSWIRSILHQSRAAGAAPFIKQLGRRPQMNGEPLKLKDAKGGDMSEWPEDLRVREFPHPRGAHPVNHARLDSLTTEISR